MPLGRLSLAQVGILCALLWGKGSPSWTAPPPDLATTWLPPLPQVQRGIDVLVEVENELRGNNRSHVLEKLSGEFYTVGAHGRVRTHGLCKVRERM